MDRTVLVKHDDALAAERVNTAFDKIQACLCEEWGDRDPWDGAPLQRAIALAKEAWVCALVHHTPWSSSRSDWPQKRAFDVARSDLWALLCEFGDRVDVAEATALLEDVGRLEHLLAHHKHRVWKATRLREEFGPPRVLLGFIAAMCIATFVCVAVALGNGWVWFA